MNENKLSNLDINEIKPDFLFEVTVIHDPDISVLNLQDLLQELRHTSKLHTFIRLCTMAFPST